MRLGIAGLGHETITFWPGLTDLEEFERNASYGEEVIESQRGTNTSIGGFIEVCEAEGVEMYPVCAAMGGATATVSDEVYKHYVGKMREGFKGEAEGLDGVLLSLHGAMVTESLQDTETHIIRDVRRAFGYEKPLMAALDLHGNLSPDILDEAKAVFGYQSSPHVDAGETGRRTAEALISTLRGEINPVSFIEKPGVVIPSVFSATTVDPAMEIIERLRYWEREPGVLDVSAFFGFAWSDVHQLGASTVAVTDDDIELAREVAEDLSSLFWERRRELNGSGKLYSVEAGIKRAVETSKRANKPIILLDHADRTNDTTFVLRELLKREVNNAAHPLLYDPSVAEKCHNLGEGAKIELNVGAGTSWRDGGPVKIRGEILWTGEGRYTGSGPMRVGQDVDLGKTAILDVNGVWLQLVSRRSSLIDADPFTKFGYNAEDFDIIVTKSKTHFRAVYEELGEEIVIVDAPGQCPADLSVFEYSNVPSGLYPITMR
ncbi:MAG: M81 family metallopeptidase [Candidatus Bathyarchaeia archaeon]